MCSSPTLYSYTTSFTIFQQNTFLCQMPQRPKQVSWVLDHTWTILSLPRSQHSKVSLFCHKPVSFASCICGIISFIRKIMLLCATHEPMLLALTIIWVYDSSKLNSHLELSPKTKPIQTWHVAYEEKDSKKLKESLVIGYTSISGSGIWKNVKIKFLFSTLHVLNALIPIKIFNFDPFGLF